MKAISKQTYINDFRLYLQEELLERCRKNPRYSLRAFAKSLGIGSPALTEILNKKRPLTKKMKSRLGLALGLAPNELYAFDLGTKSKKGDSQSELNYKQITLDNFAIISDWYHYAIMELLQVKGFKNDVAWVSRVLGISKSEANIAIERLLRVGLLEIDKRGKWIDTSGGISTNIHGELTSAASRKLQRQILEMSIRALEEVSISKRSHTSSTMAIHVDRIPQAIEKIKKFRRELSQFLASEPGADQVYHLNLSLYPVTEISRGDENEK